MVTARLQVLKESMAKSEKNRKLQTNKATKKESVVPYEFSDEDANGLTEDKNYNNLNTLSSYSSPSMSEKHVVPSEGRAQMTSIPVLRKKLSTIIRAVADGTPHIVKRQDGRHIVMHVVGEEFSLENVEIVQLFQQISESKRKDVIKLIEGMVGLSQKG